MKILMLNQKNWNNVEADISDAACNLISSLYNDKGDIQVVDTLNKGAISNMPDDVVVEVSCKITKDGPVPIPVGELPLQTVGLIIS